MQYRKKHPFRSDGKLGCRNYLLNVRLASIPSVNFCSRMPVSIFDTWSGLPNTYGPVNKPFDRMATTNMYQNALSKCSCCISSDLLIQFFFLSTYSLFKWPFYVKRYNGLLNITLFCCNSHRKWFISPNIPTVLQNWTSSSSSEGAWQFLCEYLQLDCERLRNILKIRWYQAKKEIKKGKYRNVRTGNDIRGAGERAGLSKAATWKVWNLPKEKEEGGTGEGKEHEV